jgi:hypothetical protein
VFEFRTCGHGNIDIFGVNDNILNRPSDSGYLTRNYFDGRVIGKPDFGNLFAQNVSIAGIHHLLARGEIGPELKSIHPAAVIAFGHFLMDDPAAGRHPLNISRAYSSFVPKTVSVFDIPVENIGDGLNPAMGMPGKALYVVLGIIGTEIVQKQKRVEKRHLAEAEHSLQVNAGSLNSWDALQDFPDFSYRRHLSVPPVD